MTETRVTAADTPAATDGPGAPAPSDRAVLVVYAGAGSEASTRVVEIPDDTQLTIGRSRTANIHVESERVSRIHARFTRHGASLIVEDTGSRNGTWVNGVIIDAPYSLASGDEVVVGPATIVVTITSRVVARAHVESSRFLDDRLAAEVDRGHRYHRPLALVMIAIDGDIAEADAAVDRVAALLRPMDVFAEYSPAELAIVAPELGPGAAEEVAAAIATAARCRDRVPVDSIRVAVGVAVFPGHGTTPDSLIARARAAVESARRAGGATVGIPPAEPIVVAGVVGDPQMKRVYELVHKVADHPITVLVCGETGVGKEVVAAAIHAASKRNAGPLVSLNCASLPETLLESELFGHERGAFTGADRRKHGYFEAAVGGTLFLDEIGELAPPTQAKLLRVLEERRITRVGGTDEIEVDVRVVCATNRDLEAEAARGAFRSDLYFRISGFTILIPPLRDRPDEIIQFAEYFLRQAVGPGGYAPALTERAVAALRRYAWPGNVRELRNAIERANVVHTDGVIDVEDLPDRVREARAPAGTVASIESGRDVRDRMAELERNAIIAALDACRGNQTEAAKQLGLSRRTLIYRMEKHGLKPPPASAR
jgi:DNA-binding NtrC family response regulator